MGSLFGNIVRGIGGAVGTVARSPLGKMVPYLGTALTVGSAVSSLIPGQGGMPAMPAMPSNGPGGGFVADPRAGKTGWFRNDPNTRKELEASAIAKGDLRVSYRSPARGYVVVRDDNGDPMAIPKHLAKIYYGWKPAKKPLLSIRDTNAIRRAGTAIKKLQRAEKMAKKIANWHTPHRSAPKMIQVTGRRVK